MPIAVIGIALRVPGATTPGRFWQNLVEGRDCLSRPSADALRRSGISQERLSSPDFVRVRPALDDIEHFDAEFFAMSAREAERTDPGQRLFLECAWESLESAGVVPGRHGPVTGVFGGCEGNYRQEVLSRFDDPSRDPSIGLPLRIGNTVDFLTTRVSHKLDLTGPSFGVMAACATSLLAIDLAVQSLRRGECEMALAGGVTIDIPRLGGYWAGMEGLLSPTGRLRPFDAAADGTIFGSGVGLVALRPLAAALAAGNPIHAVLRGSASSNDGDPAGKDSFIAPSPEGQLAAIEAALRDAGISPETIGYVEAHGTGTLLGDPVEVAALTEVYRRYSARTGYCSLGSVKANVGHLRCAAGVVSFIKACLALSHGIRPPLANLERPNPLIDFAASPFLVHMDARPWERGRTPRRAAVSSFGFGGSNVHLILEEHRPAPAPPAPRRPHLFVISARSEPALARRIEDLGVHLDQQPALSAADVAHTLQLGRRAFSHRACFLADGEHVAPAVLRRRPLASGIAPPSAAAPLFLFPGQGSQRSGAGRQLYAREGVYRDVVDECAGRLAPELGLDLVSLLGYGGRADHGVDVREVLRRTAHAQPALFVVGYAAARLFMSWGVTPAAMLGHSVGELVAACLAGVFSLADGLRLVAARARLMQQCEPGSMAAVFLPEGLLAPRLPPSLEIAAVNTPSISVISGPTDEVARFCAALGREDVGTQLIDTSHAFHSRMMEPILPEFTRLVADVPLSPPRVPVISNATGLPLSADQATDPRYWASHVRSAVRFSAGAQHLLALAAPAFVELGPGSTLCDLIRRHDPAASVFPLLPSADSAPDEATAARAALGGLWCAGVEVDWRAGGGAEGCQLLPLPTYPFQRLRCWRGLDESEPRDPRTTLYERGFSPAPLPPPAPAGSADAARPWLLLGGHGGLEAALRERLLATGASVTTLVPGDRFSRAAQSRFRVRADSRADLGAVLAACGMVDAGLAPRVLHLGSVTGSAGPHNTAEAFESAVRTGFFSLLALVQAAHDQGLSNGLDVLMVADGLARLDGEPGLRHAEKAALLGAARDLQLELPDLRARVVDIPCQDDAAAPAWLVEALLREASAADSPVFVCLRPEARLVEQLYALPELPESSPRLRDGGVVLITGGTGGLGLLFAGALFDLCRARLALTARWAAPPEATWPERARRDDKIGRALAAILALRARGAEVLVVQADVADRAQVARALAETRARFGGLHGVIHAAVAVQPSAAIDKTRESAARVFGSKVHGAFHLEELLGDEPLDLFLQISSQASQFPEPGQVDYAAANAVLDTLAQNRAGRHRGLSSATGWGPWQEVGLAANYLRLTLDAGGDRTAHLAGGVRNLDFGQLDHPILRSWARESSGEFVYRGILRRGHWLVDDHLIEGQPLLSGTTTLQLARTGFLHHSTEAGAVELTRVAFQRPLFTDDDGTEIELRFVPSGEDEAFSLRSRPLGTRGDWRVNSTGYVRRTAASSRPAPAPPHRAWEAVAAAPGFGGGLLTGGPRWQWRRVELEHAGRAWSQVALPPETTSDLEVFDLHPGLLDGALTLSLADGKERVPHTYDSVRIFAALAPALLSVTAHRSLGASDAQDTTIMDLDGHTLVEVEGYVMRRLEGSSLVQESRARRTVRGNGAGPVAGPRRVLVTELGGLDSLRVEPLAPRAPGPGEVQIEVHAAGLNFRDVLAALGQMPDAGPGPLAPGGECSGVVRAVGPGVRRLAPGDPVVAIARASMGTHTTTSAHAVALMPASLDFERAAGIPIVFLTAQYALETLARLQPGERVLIHAAAGGVGLAAIQIARFRGAEIFATAGHPEKRRYLRALGIEHVFDSRSFDFVEEIRAVTGGDGVDVVLNSLAGQFIPASLGLLRSQGRFVEIGKRDLLDDTPLGLAPFLRNLTFTAFDLGRLVDERHPALPAMLDALMDRFARGELRPLPTEVIPLESAEKGFRRMARAEHIGKIAFRVRVDPSPRSAVARVFEETYGMGVPVEWGLDVFRRLLSWSEAPPYVLAMGAAVDGVRASDVRPRIVAGAGRRRDAVETEYRAPGTAVERALTELWEKVLGFSPIGIDDHFFDLGGDSIEAIQIQHGIHREFDLRIKNTEFLANPTIGALAALIAAQPASTATADRGP
jgi:acyl transferase domain-containing protein/D-arabinose 1-dehydrogenase-like Zn-dependent alcohol dehydrogenase/acyl carrier protein